MKKYLEKIINEENLSVDESMSLMSMIMDGELNPSQVTSIIVALRCKGESLNEILGFAQAMRNNMKKAAINVPSIDMCGTGGDSFGSFNISTVASFVVAGAGINVAKHGNRSISSKCGSADVLEELGIDIDISISKTILKVEKNKLGFLYAPKYHPAMKFAAEARNSIKIKTIFNLLGPLTNPANAQAQSMGIFNKDLTEQQAKVLQKLGVKRGMVFCGYDGLDEITITTKTRISLFDENSDVRSYDFNPEDYGYKIHGKNSILGGSSKDNAKITIDILKGEKGPKRDIVILNAASGIIVSGSAKNFNEAISIANHSIDSGKAYEVLKSISK